VAQEQEEFQRRRRERQIAYQRDAGSLKQAMVDAGIDPTDFGRFVNRPFPGVLDPTHFDAERAVPLLLEWLPKITNEHVKESIVRHLKTRSAKRIATTPLIREFNAARSPGYQWVVGDALTYVASKDQYDSLVELAADRGHGEGRSALVGMLWRVKTMNADRIIFDALDDPPSARAAMSALRRRVGNAQARPHIEPLVDHPHEWVRDAAKDHLRRIDRASKRAG
jgi:HEAT repeat protein